jgi:hypothetical protein
LAGNGAQRGVPGWKPLQPLKPIELQNAGFVQQNFIRAKPSNFALWTVEEQLAASKMAESDGSETGIRRRRSQVRWRWHVAEQHAF